MNKIRTRFAPSPTGYLHIGGLRTALYAYIFARQNKGTFVLRIEDTDQSREVTGAVENLLKSLKWAGLQPDEGVLLDKQSKIAEKGNFGPYTQSKRLDIYQKYAQELLNNGHAYKCFCSPERLDEVRQKQQAMKQPTGYDEHCRALSAEEVKNKIDAGEKYVIRMKLPENKEVVFEDEVRGKVKFHTKEMDDQVLVKSDGFPTYHLASVVDDHLMDISHVIRGEEWLSSTPKHILLYEFFGWDIPVFAHLPLLLNPDKTKLSKRQGDVAVEDYRDQGYLSEVIINFVALLGWNPGTDQEIFSLEELIKIFDLKKVHKAGAVLNREKLDWMNGEYIKNMSPEKFISLARPILDKKDKTFSDTNKLEKILKIEQERIKKITEVGDEVNFFFADELQYEPEILIWKKSDQKTTKENLEKLIEELETYSDQDWTAEILEQKIKDFIANSDLDNGSILWPMRVALTGQKKSPPPFEVAEILGKEGSLDRLQTALKLL